MAKTGLLYPTYAPLTARADGAAPTYGTGKIFAHAIQANVAFNSADNPLYGDDKIIENDKAVTGASITLGVDDIDAADRIALFGDIKTSATGETEQYITDAEPPEVGVGFIAVGMKGGVKYYEVHWMYCVQFAQPSRETATRGESIEWQTPSMEGTAIGVRPDASGVTRFAAYDRFETLTAALAALKDYANIST